eukprot:GHVU01128357.1.p1 GENE.GHVU01128357.1~~GHVU01128357.1.p1  ORF type:complete len:143 (-),score=18.14 GHVU01128357.1:421-849(-)
MYICFDDCFRLDTSDGKWLTAWVAQNLPSKSTLLQGGSKFSHWLTVHPELAHIMLVTDKKTEAPAFKRLSYDFGASVVTGVLPHTESQVMSKFDTKGRSLPAIYAIYDGDSLEGEWLAVKGVDMLSLAFSRVVAHVRGRTFV